MLFCCETGSTYGELRLFFRESRTPRRRRLSTRVAFQQRDAVSSRCRRTLTQLETRRRMNITPRIHLTVLIGTALCGAWCSQAQTAIPPSYAMPAGSVDTTKAGFRVRPYQTDAAHGGTLSWSEDQLVGAHGPNIADLTGADSQGYLTISTVV